MSGVLFKNQINETRRKTQKIMKIPLLKTSFLSVFFILAGERVDAAVLLAGWNFNSQSTGTAPTTLAGEHGGTLDLSGLANSSDASIGGGGTSVNKFTGDNNGNDFFVAGGSSQVENGKSIIFSFSTSGYQNIVLTYASTATSTGFNSQLWSYSTDGSSFTSFATITGMATAYSATGTEMVDFSSATTLNNASAVYFALTLSGASNGGGSDHFDNFQFNGSLSAVPEPATWGVISALGLLGICGLREWRQRKQVRAV